MKGIVRALPLWLGVLLVACVVFWRIRKEEPVPIERPRVAVRAVESPVSVLATAPDWRRLDVWQGTVTREEFESLLVSRFVTGEGWREWIDIREEEVLIRAGVGDGVYRLRFAKEAGKSAAARRWRVPEELPKAPEGRPLEGLHIALDPGHIGGKWAKMEERWLVVDGGPPIQEGDMTLLVAKRIRPQLERLGAKVSLVRDKPEPVTTMRPGSLERLAGENADSDSPEAIRRLAERLFYRTAEIRARAERVNQVIRPDLVVCLHFNADPWGDPAAPELVDRSHFHILLNGAYTESEVAMADQRFAMLEKLLSGTGAEEARVAESCARAFAEASGLPPFLYPDDDPNALGVPGQPYLWARNLLANRLYECPVLFYEPYVMNSTRDHPRMVAGDYDGVRTISGKPVRSIFREYADAVVEGLRQHYGARRR